MKSWLLFDGKEEQKYFKDLFASSFFFFLNIYWPASRPAQWSLVLSGNDTNNPLLCQSQVEPQSLIRGGEEFYLSKRKSSFKAQWECSTPNETLAAIRCTSEAHRVQTGQRRRGGKKNLYSTLMSSYCRAELSSNSFLSLILCQIYDDKLHICCCEKTSIMVNDYYDSQEIVHIPDFLHCELGIPCWVASYAAGHAWKNWSPWGFPELKSGTENRLGSLAFICDSTKPKPHTLFAIRSVTMVDGQLL